MKKEVAIIGVGMSQFGELWDRSFRSMIVEVGMKSIHDARISPKDIDGLFGGNMSAGQFVLQEHLASLAMDEAGLLPKPAMRLEAACASGGIALRAGYMAIKSGIHDIVIAGGFEKMTDVLSSRITGALATASDQEWEAFYGATFPGIYAMIAQRHMHEFGTTEEQLASVAVKNHKNGSMNPHAQFQNEITLEQVMDSTPVASPLKLLDGEEVEVLGNPEDAHICYQELKEKYPEVKLYNPCDDRKSEVCLKNNSIPLENVVEIAKKYGLQVVETGFATHILKENMNKAVGFKRLGEKLGLKLEETAAIGDSPNDIEIVQQATFGVALQNAKQPLKDVADYVTKEEHGKGVMEVVDLILEKYQ